MASEVSAQDNIPVLHTGATTTSTLPMQILTGGVTQSVSGIKDGLTRQLLHALESLMLATEEPAQAVVRLGSFFQTQIIDLIAESRARWKEEREKVDSAWQEGECKYRQRAAELNTIQAKVELDYQSKLAQAEREGQENISKAHDDVNSWREPIEELTKEIKEKLPYFKINLYEHVEPLTPSHPSLSRDATEWKIKSPVNRLQLIRDQLLPSRSAGHQFLRDVSGYSGIILLAYAFAFLVTYTSTDPVYYFQFFGSCATSVVIFIVYPWVKFHRRRWAKRAGEEVARIRATALSYCDYWLAKAKADHQATIDQITQPFETASAAHRTAVEEANENLRTADAARQHAMNNINQKEQEEQAFLSAQLMPVITETHACADRLSASLGWAATAWDDPAWSNWQPVTTTAKAVRIGQLVSSTPDLDSLSNAATPLILPAVVNLGRGGLLVASVHQDGGTDAIGAVQGLLFRQLAAIPPGKVHFVLIDPIGLGENVAPVLRLADHAEVLLTSKAWSEPQQVERQLSKLTEHIENVIQKYLRTKYRTIDEYNAKAAEIAEPYRVLVVFDFPMNFTETAAKRLVSIAKNGPRCGVHTVVVADRTKKAPYAFSWADLEQASTVVELVAERWSWPAPPLDTWDFVFDREPAADLQARIIESIGVAAKQAMRVEVPYEKLLDKAGLAGAHRWEKSTAHGISVPLGPTGANELQHLSLGEGTAHHALVVGRPGSGKSNLLHVLIMTAALAYDPSELQFDLIDFKKGVEFKPYAEARLPHARVIAIESEREFGLSVLSSLDEELKWRGNLFRASGANSIVDYRSQGDEGGRKGKTLPRLMLIIDEFQEFFTQDDRIARDAGLLLDRLVRQGRAFGIHVILCTQTLAGSYNLARSTIDQMAVRIALQCSEADSRLILADDNPAARLLSRPGEGIYNAATGLVEGNFIFQVARFNMDEDGKRYFLEIEQLARRTARTAPTPIIFEGHEPAQIESCQPLTDLLSSPDWPVAPKVATAWLGESIAIRAPNILPPTVATFPSQSGSHLLVVAREEAEGIGLLTAAVLSLVAHHRPDDASFYIANLTTSDTEWADIPEDMADLLPHSIDILRRRDLAPLLCNLSQMVRERSEEKGGKSREVYLVILGLQRARELRQDDSHWAGVGESSDRAPSEHLADILRDGPEVGIHVLVWCDTYANVTRTLGRSAVREFGIRIGTAMSSDDSMSLLDDSAASHLDRPHRAILIDENRVGAVEKFRPYWIPERAWLEAVARDLRARTGEASLERDNS